MIHVYDTFVCKPGNASKMAKLMKETMTGKELVNVLTDMTGQYHKVVMISQFADMTDYQKSFEKWSKPTPEMKKMSEKFVGMQEMYTSGSREIYKVW